MHLYLLFRYASLQKLATGQLIRSHILTTNLKNTFRIKLTL